MTVLVTRAASPKALIVTRSLGKRGIEVVTADHKKHGLASLSRYSRQFFQYPSPKENPEGFINALETYLKDNPTEVLIPTHSEDTYIVAKHRARLGRYTKVPLHDYDTIATVNDKGQLATIAEKLGVPIPRTFQPQDLGELRSVAARATYPVVIKLRGRASSVGMSYACSEDDLLRKYRETVDRFSLPPEEYPIVQEYISGDGYGVSSLYNKGALRAQFTHRRIREYPTSGGPSTCRISVKHPLMESYARKLLEHFSWHGLAMVEFKMDSRTGTPYLLEINPRIWGSVNQAIASGVDFPYLLYRMAVDGDVEPVLDYRLGVITRNCFIDSASVVGNFRKTIDPRLLLELFKPYRDDIVSLDDLRPALGFTYAALRAGLQS
jgi:predicted ATP-grasp superfamily ATP-dependent carboligase